MELPAPPSEKSHGSWNLPVNDSKLRIRFANHGSPVEEKGRFNQLSLASINGGLSKILLRITADPTENIVIPRHWLYLVRKSPGETYLILGLRMHSDGEDPSPKPVFIVTNGRTAVVKKYRFDEKYHGSWKGDILVLLAEISHQPADSELKKAVNAMSLITD